MPSPNILALQETPADNSLNQVFGPGSVRKRRGFRGCITLYYNTQYNIDVTLGQLSSSQFITLNGLIYIIVLLEKTFHLQSFLLRLWYYL